MGFDIYSTQPFGKKKRMGFRSYCLSKTAELDLQDSSKSAQEVEKSQNETLLWVVHSSPTLFNAICNAQGQFECATLKKNKLFYGYLLHADCK